jgi:hypothetical protein
MGRRSKCTPKTRDKVCKAIKMGTTYAYAAQYAGIARGTFFRWMQIGAEAESGRYRDFHDAVKEAEGFAVMEACAVIKKASYAGVWTAAAWLLERRFGYVKVEAPAPEPEEETALPDMTTAESIEAAEIQLASQLTVAMIKRVLKRAQEG